METEKKIAEPKAEPKANVAAVKTAEEWARERGHFPEFSPAPVVKGQEKAVRPPVHNPKFRLYREAFFLHGWVQGKEMTLAQYDAAVDAAQKHVYR